MSLPTVDIQLKELKNLIDSYPLSSLDRAAWARAKSRSSFRPSSPFRPLPCIPISNRTSEAKIFWRKLSWSQEAPSKLLPGLQLILDKASGPLKNACLRAIQYFRIKHYRAFKPGFPTVPPLSEREKILLPKILISTLNTKPGVFSIKPKSKPLPPFELAKIKEALKVVYSPKFFVSLVSDSETSEGDSDIVLEEATPDTNRDQFSFVEGLPRPEATKDRHHIGKRRSVRSRRFSSSDFIF